MRNVKEQIKLLVIYFLFSCTSTNDDPFRSCFGCERANENLYYANQRQSFHSYIDRQTGEMFQATTQSRRVLCNRGTQGNRRCRLRIDKAMQFRRVSYGRAVQFIQSEQYLNNDDVDIIR